MGKSNKKAKSEKINALRKQYDAFLEEDKKRKERNDFILGKLDKMRYTTALVPVRYKPNSIEASSTVLNRLGYQPELSSVRDLQPCITNQNLSNILVKSNEDSNLIMEISKKYILIPKLRTTLMPNYITEGRANQNIERLDETHRDQDRDPIKDLKQNINENMDWKSKYEILNILKNEEKEKQSEFHQTSYEYMGHNENRESVLENNQDQININNGNHIKADPYVAEKKEYVDMFPEKDLSTDTLHDLPRNSMHDLNNTEYVNIASAPTDSHYNNGLVLHKDEISTVSDHLQNLTLEYKDSVAPSINASREESKYYEPQPESVNINSTIVDNHTTESTYKNENPNSYEYPADDGVNILHGQSVSDFANENRHPEEVGDVDKITTIHDFNPSSTPDVKQAVTEHDNFKKDSNIQEFSSIDDVQVENIITPQEQIITNTCTIEQSEQVFEQPGHVFEETGHVIEQSGHVSEQSGHVIEQPGHVFDQPGHLSEQPEHIIEQPEQIVEQSGSIMEHSESVNDQTEPVAEQIGPGVEINQADIAESIGDFDVEQKEMFYSEPTEENYHNQQGDPNIQIDYSQGEYQNQEYTYYDNTEAGGYMGEINDEEVTQPYDPNYAQQYGGLDQGFEQHQYVQQYQEPGSDVNTEYEMQQYEQFESQGNVEGTLNVENDYVAQAQDAHGAEVPNVEAIETNTADSEKVAS